MSLDLVDEVAAPGWDTSCPDWEERILAGRSLIPSLPLFDAEAERALRVFKRLRVPDMVGNPTYGEVSRPWVLDLVRVVFGSYDPELKRRMIREFFLLIPKKNGKSSIAAAIIVTAAILNVRPEAELLLIAPTKLIADIAYKQASGIIRLDPELLKIFWPRDNLKLIWHRLTGAVIMIKASDTDVITGGKATYTLIDETHEFAAKPKATDVFTELRGALAARKEGFLLQITTQSKKPPAGVFKAELHTARDVRDGNLRLPLLAILYELPPGVARQRDSWRDPRYWGVVNPNLGASVDPVFLRDQIVKADREGQAALALLASQHFNVELGIGLRTDAWPGARFWERRPDAELAALAWKDRLQALIRRCEVVVIGIDGGGLDDLFGLVVLGRERETRDWLAAGHAWCHEGVLEERPAIASALRDFETAGDLTIVGDELGDITEIVEVIELVNDSGLLACVAIDVEGPYGELVDALAAVQITEAGEQVIGVGQGYKLMNAIKTCERKLANGTLRHDGSGLMAWCAGNLKIEATATAIRATKQNAGDAKIDVSTALFDAATVMTTNPEPKGGRGSIYDMADAWAGTGLAGDSTATVIAGGGSIYDTEGR